MGRRKKISNIGAIFYLVLGWMILNALAGIITIVSSIFVVPFVFMNWIATHFPLGIEVFIIYLVVFWLWRGVYNRLRKINNQRRIFMREIHGLKHKLGMIIEEEKRNQALELSNIDRMSGLEFEHYVGRLLSYQGFQTKVTQGSNDLGVDVVAKKDDRRIAIQVKCYSSPVPRTAVSDAVAGKDYYDCNEAMVITNNVFTKGAKKLANSTQCQLVDRSTLAAWIVMFQKVEKVIETDEILDIRIKIEHKYFELQKIEHKLTQPQYRFMLYFSENQWLVLFFLGFLASEILAFAYSNIHQFFQEILNTL